MSFFDVFKFAKRIIAFGFLVLFFSTVSYAGNGFVVKHIRILGLHRIKYSTVLNYLPVKTGQRFDLEDSPDIIKTLYATGFFDNVGLSRSGSVLIVIVEERPTIAQITIGGNKDLASDKLKELLKKVGLVEGHVLNRAVLDRMRQELKTEYNNRGKYNARVDIGITALPRKRVKVSITISEGMPAKIKEIRIIGAHAFPEKELKKHFLLRDSGFLLFVTHANRYSQPQLNASLEGLRAFYLDHGYLHMRIVSTQVSLTPDHKHVYVTIKIEEGAVYTISGYTFAGKLVLPREKLVHYVLIHKGDLFARTAIGHSIEGIGHAIGNLGYAFPRIEPLPKIDEKRHQVFITFLIQPGRIYYVRRINFFGNTKTADYVLRHAMVQEEGALIMMSKVHESERQLRILPFLKDVGVQTVPVPGTNNQVDLNFNAKEARAAAAKLSIGYSSAYGVVINASFNNPNFRGTGKTVGVSARTDNWGRTYNIMYFNPYYTPYGVGRGIVLHFEQTDPSGKADVSRYRANKYAGNLHYSMLLSDHDSLQFGYGFSYFDIKSLGFPAAPQRVKFLARYGHVYNQINLALGWEHNTYNRFPFPTMGTHQNFDALISLPAGSNGLTYYKLFYTAQWYHPLFYDFILSLHAAIGYGNGLGDTDGLPFFENYFSGGVGIAGQVRGYKNYSLGPLDTTVNMDALGGNLLLSGSVALILPYPLTRQSVRTEVFIDAGNVYSSGVPVMFQGTGSGPLRYSAGIGVEWNSPMGPLLFSLATPLNKQGPIVNNSGMIVRPGDRTKTFQFTVSSGY